MFFNGWDSLGRILIVGVLAYAFLVLFLRISGKRTLSKMNAFDLVVTVALGSTLATILLSKQASLADGLLALGLLIGLQYVVAWLAVRVRWFQSVIKSEPSLLLYQGQYLDAELKRQRVTRDEVLAALRSEGVAEVTEVLAVVLETDGTFSVVTGNPTSESSSSLTNLRCS